MCPRPEVHGRVPAAKSNFLSVPISNGTRGEMVLRVGDGVLYRSDRGIFIRYGGENLVVLKESTDIIGLIGKD